ncbi:MAG: EAL domain-containing protein [Nevskiales bacterium]|nr:EAL domain-containing protein [Nevskiales bacterium]
MAQKPPDSLPDAVLLRIPATELFRGIPTPAAVLGADGQRVLAVNPALLASSGLSEDALLAGDFEQLRRAVCAEGGKAGCTERVLRVSDADGDVLVWFAEPGADDSERPQRDPATGLLDKHAFEARLRRLLNERRDGVLIRFEVDQFKLINDAYGRAAGAQLLAELGRLIAAQVRGEDEPAYLGGDDFAVLLEGCDLDHAWHVAERVRLQVAAQGFEWSGRGYGVTVSVGIASFADAYQDLGELMKAADVACEASKSRGRNRIEIFHRDDSELERVRGEQSWGARVLDVLEDGKFALFRQRITPLHDDLGPEHYEVLLRIRGLHGWTVPPDFVVAAERYGLMPQVDRRIIARTLRQLARVEPGERAVMAINLSGSSLSDQSLAAYISRMLEQTEVSPQHVRFEITETAAIANISRAVALVGSLRELGCRVALDDFGAGMSSFSYLKSLEVDMIKIDGSFVRNVTRDAVDAATVESMVKVASLRGLQTVAECVEDAASLNRLRELGVHYAQGFFLHRPEPWYLP